uniref:Uncharacterized protein n=1 Tax=Tetradesmus obliquus TaxID=3088 RepID=A0A383WN69_TETOB
MCLDVPSDVPTSAVLKQDLWQLLVGGEDVNVPARESGSSGIWHLLPEYYKAICHSAAETVNPLREFLRAPRPEGACSVTRHFALYEDGAMTAQSQLVLALHTFMKFAHPGVRAPSKWSGDEVQPLYEEGYERKTLAICKACRQPHKTGCCEHYGSKNKTTTQIWLNLRLVAVEPTHSGFVDDGF